MDRWRSEREVLWEVTREMVHCGLVAGSSGNASMRLEGGPEAGTILITPFRSSYRHLGPEHLAVIDLDGQPGEEEHLPSSEAALHLALYKSREDIGAVLHTHSVFASVAAVGGVEIPPLIDEMVLAVGGSVPVAEYGFPSTEELADGARQAIRDRNAVLLRNHGLVGVGRDPWDALEVCQLVERAAQIFVYASLWGKVVPLPAEAVNMGRELFRMQRTAQALRGTHGTR